MKRTNIVKSGMLIVVLLAAQFMLSGQAPENVGWYSQEPLAMSKNQCYDKAVQALRSSGLTDLRTQDGWTASASNYNMRAGISCIACGNGVTVSVSVAATHAYPEANNMRNYLRDYMLNGTTRTGTDVFTDINGTWTCSVKCPAGGVGKPARFEQNGSELVFFNEGGQRFTGYFKDQTTFGVHGSTITGTITNNGKKINWSNGSVWVR